MDLALITYYGCYAIRPNQTRPKVNIIDGREFELDYSVITVQHFSTDNFEKI